MLIVGGFGHAVCVFDEWFKDFAPVTLVGAVQTLPDETLDQFLSHPWARQFNSEIFHDLRQAITQKKPDIVVVSTRPHLNPEIIETCLYEGCHVIAEKPLAVNKEGLIRIRKAVGKTGRLVLPMLHTSLAIAQAKEMVEQGCIGRPVLVNARKSYQWGNRAKWFNDRKNYSGMWAWVGIHSFNQAVYITNCQMKKIVAVQEGNFDHPEFTDCPDCLTGLFELENNIQMTGSIDLLRPNGQKEWGDDWIRVVGTEGSIEVNPALQNIRLIRKGHEEAILQCDGASAPFYTPFINEIINNQVCNEWTNLGIHLTNVAISTDIVSHRGSHGVSLGEDSI